MRLLTILSFILLFTFTSFAQVNSLKKVPQDGVVVIEFNAGWNSTTPNVTFIEDLTHCKKGKLLICANPSYQKQLGIVVVPTVIIFKDGEELTRFQANIMQKVEFTQKEVQEAVDEAHMEGF